MSPPAVPSGQSPPIEVIDATHHGAWVIIATALGLLLGIVCFLIRLYVRVVITPPFGRDDHVAAAAMAFAFIQSVVVFIQVSRGFGTSLELLNQQHLDQIQKIWVTSDILFLVGIYASKCSLIFLFLRLTPSSIHNKISWATFGLSSVWLSVSALIVAANCELNYAWPNIAARCANLFVRWQFITAVDIIIEVILVCLAAYLVLNLKMPLTRKAAVVAAFCFRLPLIAFALLRLHYLAMGIASQNPALDFVGAAVWTQIELHYSNFSGTVPCLRPFMMAVSTEYGATEPPQSVLNSKGYGSSGSGNRKGSSYMLNSIGSGGGRMNSENNPSMFRMARRPGVRTNSSNNTFRPSRSNNKSMVTHEVGHDSNSFESNDSRKMIIRKEVGFNVEHGRVSVNDEEIRTP